MNAFPYSTENSPFKGPDNDNDIVLSYPDENSYELIAVQINFEELTKTKRDYLQNLAEEYGATVFSLQETHVALNIDTSKFNIDGFNLVNTTSIQ